MSFEFYFCPAEVLFLFNLQLWVKERMPLASSTDHGKDLPTVQLLIKKNQVQFFSALFFSKKFNNYVVTPLA